MSTYPAFQVDVAWGVASSAIPSGGDWVDITADTVELSSMVGRTDEWSQPGAGTCTLVINNAGGHYDPDNASGDNYGDLLPLTWVRILGGTTTANTGVFYGKVSIDGWRLSASQFPDSYVTVELVDAFEDLANTLLPGSVYAIEVQADTPEWWWRLGESSGTTAVDSSGNGHHAEVNTFNSRTGLVAGDEDNALLVDPGRLTLPAGQQIRSDWDFSVEGWVDVPDAVTYNGTIWRQSNHGEAAPSGAVSSIFVGFQAIANEAWPYVEILVDGAAAADGAYRIAGSALSAGIHHIAAYIPSLGAAVPAGIKLYVDGEAVTGTTGGVLGTLPAFPTMLYTDAGSDATLDEIAGYDGELSAVRIAAHYTAGTDPWASELTSARLDHLFDAGGFTHTTIDTGQSTMPAALLGGGDLLSAALDVVKAERGEMYADPWDSGKVRFRDRHALWTDSRSITSQVTFGDSGSEVTYTALELADDRIVNSASVQRSGGATVTVTDSASITQYQTRSYSESGLLLEDDTEVESRAHLILAEKKDRYRRVRSITLEPADDSHGAWAHVFARQIGDRVTSKWRPAYGGTYSWDSWIIGVSQRWRPGDSKPLRTQFFLRPVPYGTTAEPYFIVSVSEIESDARVGY